MYSKLQKYSIYLVLGLITLSSTWALFNSDFFRFHDFTQGARIVEMTTALKDGHFPVIWSSNLGFGYGMPLFEFYAPLPYYVGSLFYMVGFSLINSIKAIIFISSFFTAIGAFLLGKKLYGNLGGLLVSAAITMAPYRAVNLYVRGAVSEAWGIMALPFILLGIIKTIKNEKYGWQLLTISILVLLLSHNLTALVFLPFSVLFGAGYLVLETKFQRSKKWVGSNVNKNININFWQTILKLAGVYSLAVMMSLFYSAPAFLEKDFTRLESTILAEYFNYKLHFVGIRQFFIDNWGYGGSTYGPMDGISFYLGFGQLVGLFFSVYLFIRKYLQLFRNKAKSKFKAKNTQLQNNFWSKNFDNQSFLYLGFMVLLGISLFMTTNKSMIIWNNLELLSFLQFPWRYLSAVTIFLGLLLGYIVKLLPNKYFKYGYSLVLIVVILAMNSVYFQPEEFTSDLGEYYYSDPNKLRTDMSTTLPDYIPSQITQKEISPVALEGQVLYCQVLENCKNQLGIVKIDEINNVSPVNKIINSFEVLKNQVHKKELKTNFETEKEVVFAVANFPGWRAKIDNQKVELTTSKEGFIKVNIPAGEHTISINLKDTPIRIVSTLLSMTGLVIFSSLFFWYYKRNDR